MRAALSLLVAALACAPMPLASSKPQLTTVASGAYARDDSGRKAVLATSEAAYAQRWAELIGEEEKAPPVDFTKNSVVFLLAGSRNTGGWSVEPKAVVMEGTTAVIDASIVGPPPGGIATMAFTSPWAVVTIDARAVEHVRWPQ
jgi:hypothetical protein